MSVEKLNSLQKCRDIKNEILKFGINEIELKHLIKLLCLELEDRNLMNNILQYYKEENNKIEL
tara:strand:- start:188 stop:376 length:189 start_codon:yes stop_codon:yes gene_type:complete